MYLSLSTHPSVDTIGTIIANNRATAMRPDFLQDERDQLYHIVRPDEAGANGEGRGKIISEVFLTRLLSTKVCHLLTVCVVKLACQQMFSSH